MRRLSIRIGFVASCASALALTGMAASPAWSQTNARPAPPAQGLDNADEVRLAEIQRSIQEAERLLAEAEAARQSGRCSEFGRAIYNTRQLLDGRPVEYGGQTDFIEPKIPFALSQDLARRRDALDRLPCPPAIEQSTNAAQIAGSDAPATSIIDEAGIPTGGVDGAIPPPPPAAPSTAPPPRNLGDVLRRDSIDVLRTQQVLIGDIERLIAEAEAKRVAGDCAGVRETLDNVFEKFATNELPELTLNELRRRANQVAVRECPPEDAPRNSIQIAGGYGEISIPRGNYGFMRDGPFGAAPELPALLSVPRVPVLVVEGAATFQGLGRFNLGYKEGNGRNFVDLPTGPAGTARGFPYTARSPSGSTGIAGNVPVRAESSVEVQEFSASFHIPVSYGIPDKLTVGVTHDGGPSMWAPRLSLGLFINPFIYSRERDHFGTVSITTPVIATQTIDQQLEELFVGVGAGATATISVDSGVRLNIEVEADVYGYDYGLKSVETVAQNFGPLNDRAFTNRVNASNNGVGYRGSIRGEIVVDLSGGPVDGQSRGGIQLFFGGTGAYSSDRAQIVNPPSGDFVLAGGTTTLGTDDAFDWHVFAGLRIPLGYGSR